MIHLLLVAALVTASPSDSLFQKGKAAFSAGNLTAALEAFMQAQQRDPSPELLLNIAQCHRGLGRRAEAIAALEAFLLSAPNHPLRKAAEGTLADLRAEQAADTPARVELVPAPQPVALLIAPPPPEPTRVWPWVVGGGAAVAVVAAAVAVGLVASHRPYPDLGTLRLPPP